MSMDYIRLERCLSIKVRTGLNKIFETPSMTSLLQVLKKLPYINS